MNIEKGKIFKYFLITLILLSAFFSVSKGYAIFWDELSVARQSPYIQIGAWDNVISNAQAFYNFVTKTDSVSTDEYYLVDDIDFDGFEWNYNSENSGVVFRGKLFGNNKTISNLNININNSTYTNGGIFPIMEGGTVSDLKLENVYIVLGSTALNGSSLSSGLIAGNISGLTNTISNITILNGGVRSTNVTGSGGLVGNVTGSSTVLNINNIKATNLKVFNKTSYSGGIVGRVIDSGATLNISNIDTQGEVFSNNNNSYVGGVIGGISTGAVVNISRVVTDQRTRNTLETSGGYNNSDSSSHLGGFIGQSLSSSANVTITDAFFTGSLYPGKNNIRTNIGTATGTFSNAPTLLRVHHAMVEFRAQNGSVTYVAPNATGQMATVYSNNTVMPNQAFWNTFTSYLNIGETLWAQDSTTFMPYLIR